MTTSERPPRDPALARDPRELTAEFKSLPPDLQAEFRERWKLEQRHAVQREARSRLWRQSARVDGAIVFFLTEVLFVLLQKPEPERIVIGLISAVVVGALVGIAWNKFRADRFQCLWIAVIPFLLLRGLLHLGGEPLTYFFGSLLFLALCVTAGLMNEMRASRS